MTDLTLTERLRGVAYTIFECGRADHVDSATCTEAADRIEALEAENARLTALVGEMAGALEWVEGWRDKCREYDKENGHGLRDFDVEDVMLLENKARAALAKHKEVMG